MKYEMKLFVHSQTVMLHSRWSSKGIVCLEEDYITQSKHTALVHFNLRWSYHQILMISVTHVLNSCFTGKYGAIVRTGKNNYRQTSNISGIKSPNFLVSCLVLELPLSNPLKPGVKSRMKM